MPFTYTFFVDDELIASFEIEEHRDTSLEDPEEPVPAWLALENHRCPHCRIEPGSRRTCPATLSIKPVVEAFSGRRSFDHLRVVVESESGRLETTKTAQILVRSVIGLLMALSSCPVMQKLKPMAHYHLPFGGQEHTVFRFVGTYLIGQYLRQTHGLEPEWQLSGLLDIFDEIHEVNRMVAMRIRAASKADATLNGLIMLDTFAATGKIDIEEALSKYSPLFVAYL